MDVVEAYRTMVPEIIGQFPRNLDWITFTSSSTVNNFIQAWGREAVEMVKIASIGPITSATLREHGLEATAEAKPHTIGGLIQGILNA